MKAAATSNYAGIPLKPPVLEELGKLRHEVLDLGTNSTLAVELVRGYLAARFSGLEWHQRRLNKVAGLEDQFGKAGAR